MCVCVICDDNITANTFQIRPILKENEQKEEEKEEENDDHRALCD